MYFWPLLGIKTTENRPGLRMHTHSQSITGASWLQDWPSLYSSRYGLLFTICFFFLLQHNVWRKQTRTVPRIKLSDKVFCSEVSLLFLIWRIHLISLIGNVSRCLHSVASPFDKHLAPSACQATSCQLLRIHQILTT